MKTVAGTRILVKYKDKYLFLRYSERSPDNPWDAPGGTIEGIEQPEETAIRELKEETGITVGSLLFVNKYELVQDNVRKIFYGFFCEVNSSTILLSQEHDQFAWLSLDEFDEYGISKLYSQAIVAMNENSLK